jgi:hypothetical protein
MLKAKDALLQLFREDIDWDAKKAPLTKDVVGALLDHIDALTRERDSAVLAEREACAMIAEALFIEGGMDVWDSGYDAAVRRVARDIRARSTPGDRTYQYSVNLSDHPLYPQLAAYVQNNP